MNKICLNTIFTYLLPILVGGVMLNIFNVYIVLIYLLIYLCTIEKIELAISFAIILPPFLGSIFQIFKIPLPGSLFAIVLASFFALGSFKYLQLWDFGHIVKSYITPIVVICILYYVFTGQTENSTSKIIGLTITACYSPFLMFITKSTKVNMGHLASIFIIYALLMIRVAYDFYGYAAPMGLFDFTSFRFGGYANVRDGITHVNYQNVGIAALMAASYWLSTIKKMGTLLDWIILLTSSWIVLISGARQAIIGFIIIIGVWLLSRNGRFKMKGAILFSLFIVVSILFLKNLDIEFITEMFDKRDNLDRDYTYAFFVIANNTLTGIGFGNYWDAVNDLYFAHNLFLEILCEMGVIGFMLLSIPILRFVFSNQFKLSQNFNNGALSLLVFLPYFIRSMISDDLSRNIIVFITFFIFFRQNNNEQYSKY